MPRVSHVLAGPVALMLAACSAVATPTGPVQPSATTVVTPGATIESRPWTRLPDADALHQLLPFAVAAESGTTAIVGMVSDGQGGYQDHPAFATSTDGTHWTRGTLEAGPSTGVPLAVTRFGPAVVAVGVDRCRFFGWDPGVDPSGASACQAAIWRSTDGARWSRVLDDRFEAAALTTVIDFDGLAIAAGTRGDRAVLFASSDGANWEPIEGSAALDHGVIVGLASRPGLVVAIGFLIGQLHTSIPVSWSSTDGRSWSSPVRLPAPANGYAAGLASGPQGFVAVGTAPRLVNGYQSGYQPLAWASADGITWTQTAAEGTEGHGQLLGLAGDSAGWLALGFDLNTRAVFLEGASGSSGWHLQPLADDLRLALSDAHAITWDGVSYLIVGAAGAPDGGTTTVVLSGRPAIEIGGPLPTGAPAATDILVVPPSANLSSRLDGTLVLTGSLAASLRVSGDCSGVVSNGGVLFGDGTMADGQSAMVQIDLYGDALGMQLFIGGASKDAAIIATAPFSPPTGLPTPPSGTVNITFAIEGGGSANGVLTFTCNR